MLLATRCRPVCASATTSVQRALLLRQQPNIHHQQQLPLRSSPTSISRHAATTKHAMSEEAAARAAAADADSGAPTLFDKIVAKQIPATIIYEDDLALAFRDVSPQAPTHFLVIPKDRDGLTRLSKSEERHKALLGHLMFVAQHVAKQENLLPGFRVVINDGPDACQSVYHLHLHVMGGRPLTWPPG